MCLYKFRRAQRSGGAWVSRTVQQLRPPTRPNRDGLSFVVVLALFVLQPGPSPHGSVARHGSATRHASAARHGRACHGRFGRRPVANVLVFLLLVVVLLLALLLLALPPSSTPCRVSTLALPPQPCPSSSLRSLPLQLNPQSVLRVRRCGATAAAAAAARAACARARCAFQPQSAQRPLPPQPPAASPPASSFFRSM